MPLRTVSTLITSLRTRSWRELAPFGILALIAAMLAAFGKIADEVVGGQTHAFDETILRALRRKSVMHYLGSDIRGKTPAELAFGKKAGTEVVGSYDAIRWVPEAEMIPPGIELAAIEPAPPSDRARPVILHAPSSRRRKGTEHVLAACEGLDADLVLVEGLHHEVR